MPVTPRCPELAVAVGNTVVDVLDSNEEAKLFTVYSKKK